MIGTFLNHEDTVAMWGKAHDVAFTEWAVRLPCPVVSYDETKRQGVITWELSASDKERLSLVPKKQKAFNLLHPYIGAGGDGLIGEYKYSAKSNTLTVSFWALSADAVSEMLMKEADDE